MLLRLPTNSFRLIFGDRSLHGSSADVVDAARVLSMTLRAGRVSGPVHAVLRIADSCWRMPELGAPYVPHNDELQQPRAYLHLTSVFRGRRFR